MPPGAYHALITGRGFVARGWPGSTRPGDSWRLRLWPAEMPFPARRLARFGDEDEDDDEAQEGWSLRTEHEQAGRAAALRVRDDLDHAPHARDLSASGGTVVAEHTYPYPRRRVWPYFANPQTWLSWKGNWGADAGPRIDAYFVMEHDMFPERHPDDWILGSRGDIRGQWIDIQPLSTVSYRWRWRAQSELPDKPTDPQRAWDEWLWHRWHRPGVVPDTTVRADLHTQRVDGKQHTRVVLTHSDLPTAWVDDLRDWWTWRFEKCERMLGIN